MSTNPENQSAGTSNLPPCPKAAAKICCEELTKFTIDYMDGELDPEVKRHFDSHLAFCPECKSFFDAYQCAVRMGKDCMCTGEPIHRKARVTHQGGSQGTREVLWREAEVRPRLRLPLDVMSSLDGEETEQRTATEL